jgi:hypothetical protein
VRFQQFRIMLEVSVIIFSAIEFNDNAAGLFRDSSRGFSPTVAVYKISLALSLISGEHTVDVASGAAEGKGSPVLVSVWVVC